MTFIPELKERLKQYPSLKLDRVIYYGGSYAGAKIKHIRSKDSWVIYDLKGLERLIKLIRCECPTCLRERLEAIINR